MRNFVLLCILAFVASAWAQGQCPRCTPLCVNGDGTTKTCGDDGCGGSCGTCAFGQECCRGTCVCSPNCAGRQCGDDGCGGTSCGSCSPTQTCSNGFCSGTATADCAGKVCGSNRAGGNCGSCTTGQRCRSGQCECYYDCNERNCGNAVQADGTNFNLCPQRSCGTCPNGFTCGSNGRCSALTPCTITITVVDCSSRRSIASSSSVLITTTGYSTTVTVSAGGSASWNAPSLGTFSFQTTASGYLTNTQSQSISSTTSAIELCVNPGTVQIDIRDAVTNRSITVGASVTYSGVISGSFRWSGVQTFTHGGFGSYSFIAVPDANYLEGTLTTQITSSTTLIIIYVNPAVVEVDVRDVATLRSISVGVTITYTTTAVTGAYEFRWTGITSLQHNGYGTYTFFAVPDSTYSSNTTVTTITASTTQVILWVSIASFCGDGTCDATETNSNCFLDCVALFLEFENADGSGPVNGPTVNYFLTNPRDANQNTGPNRNAVTAVTSRTTGTGSNTVLEETYGYEIIIYVETVVSNYISFYWAANTSNIDPGLGTWRLRVHLSALLGANSLNYRFVNTWRPIDAEPAPYAPTDLNLHSFHSAGALDVNNPRLIDGTGNLIGQSVADSKQSGGPATMDLSPGSGVLVALWNSKPPRSSVIAPSQNGRYLVNAGSYVVFYGKTSNAASGKQLGQIVLDELLFNNPSLKSDTTSDLWYIGTFTISQPAQNQPAITAVGKLKRSEVNSARDMIFDCEAYQYCSTFRVPYSDTGR